MVVENDISPGGYFKLKIKAKAPNVNKHYSAGYMLLDSQGNYFGDKVVLDIIVEDDCSESVILAEMMENVDMNVRRDEPNFGMKMNPRDERTSMMIHRPIPQKGAQVGQLPGAAGLMAAGFVAPNMQMQAPQ